MADQIINFDEAKKAWADAKAHMYSVESTLRMIKGYANSEENGTELACDIEHVGNMALREVESLDECLDKIEQTLVACERAAVVE